MSLKAFHIVFVVASILLAFGFAAWSLMTYSDGRRLIDLIFGIADFERQDHRRRVSDSEREPAPQRGQLEITDAEMDAELKRNDAVNVSGVGVLGVARGQRATGLLVAVAFWRSNVESGYVETGRQPKGLPGFARRR